jgi:hypothetical protein
MRSPRQTSYVQTLNDEFTDPSGDLTREEQASPPLVYVPPISASEEEQGEEEPGRPG